MARIAINGFGRIGRLTARALAERRGSAIELVSVNELADAKTCAWLFERDSVHGRFAGEVSCDGTDMLINGERVAVSSIEDPRELPHGTNAIDIVLECTGRHSSRKAARAHLAAGAGRVLISGPAEGADETIVYGINQHRITTEHRIVANASCTTNCLAIVAKVLEAAIGIERGLTRTVHGYTSEQPLLDSGADNRRRGRSALLSMIPVPTSSPEAVGVIVPELAGKLTGSSIRVPVANLSAIELIFEAKRQTSSEEVNLVLRRAATSGELVGLLEHSDLPLVSQDLNHTSASATVDGLETRVAAGRLVRVLAWYDNEWAYAQRMVDVALLMAAQCEKGPADRGTLTVGRWDYACEEPGDAPGRVQSAG